ncbi:tpr domain containing protein [Stylonychia lemnae]|uniref:Tpr domain containing protein n=1 Tax=Stylonychia lemnae TaxID=5949 RepID=A0A077ZYM6_STYLE|nr:tpr domain containing protein [Stylonychia lemnae]|eukprot:CDW73636.1 tpr domain containing protein [Stylonychia lemnae]
MKNYALDRKVDNVVIDEKTSPEVQNFFMNDTKKRIVDPRVSMVLENAEKKFFEEKQLQEKINREKQKNDYEKRVQDQLKKNREQQHLQKQMKEMAKQRQMNALGQQQQKQKMLDSINDRDMSFNPQTTKNSHNGTQIMTGKPITNMNHTYEGGLSSTSGPQHQLRSQTANPRKLQNRINANQTNEIPNQTGLNILIEEYKPTPYEQYLNNSNQTLNKGTIRTLNGAKNLYKNPTLQQQINPNRTVQQYDSLNSPNMSSMRSMSSAFSSKKYNKHHDCTDSHLPLNQQDRDPYRYYETSIKPTTFNINSQRNLFQEVDCLIIKAKSLFNQKQYLKVKQLLEQAINQENVHHADVYYLCGEANRRLENLLIAEQMLIRCLAFEFHSPFTYSSLAMVYRDQGHIERACALFKRALEQQQSPQVAFELAKLLAQQQYLTESLVYFTKAIDLSESGLGLQRDLGGEKLAEYYMHRSLIYEALGLVQLSRKDMYRIREYDETFEKKYNEESIKLQQSGQLAQSFKIKQFLSKMSQI